MKSSISSITGKNSIAKYWRNRRSTPLYPETGELNDAAMRTYLDSVLPEDREKLIRETQPEHVLLATREHGKIIVPYRRLSPGENCFTGKSSSFPILTVPDTSSPFMT